MKADIKLPEVKMYDSELIKTPDPETEDKLIAWAFESKVCTYFAVIVLGITILFLGFQFLRAVF